MKLKTPKHRICKRVSALSSPVGRAWSDQIDREDCVSARLPPKQGAVLVVIYIIEINKCYTSASPTLNIATEYSLTLMEMVLVFPAIKVS